jgi:hypothetical protein
MLEVLYRMANPNAAIRPYPPAGPMIACHWAGEIYS